MSNSVNETEDYNHNKVFHLPLKQVEVLARRRIADKDRRLCDRDCSRIDIPSFHVLRFSYIETFARSSRGITIFEIYDECEFLMTSFSSFKATLYE